MAVAVAVAASPAAAGPRFRHSPRDRAGALVRGAAAEFIGTLLFAAMGALLAAALPGVLADGLEKGALPPLWVTGAADAAALVVAAAVIGPFSGAYLNGAAVWAAVLAGDVSVLRGGLYGASQAAASMLAAALLPAPALDPTVWKDLVPPRFFDLPAPATAATAALLVGVLKAAVFAWVTLGACRALASAGKGKAATATAAPVTPTADLGMSRALALAVRGAVAFLLHVLLPRHPGGPLDLLRLSYYVDGAPATEYRAGLWLHVAAVGAGATMAGVAAWRLRLRLGRPAAADKAAVANGKVAAADTTVNGASGHVAPPDGAAGGVPWADFYLVSSMVGVLAVSVLQRAIVNMVLEGAGGQIICALTSPLFLVGRGYGCSGPVFNKLEEWLFMVMLNSASLTSVILVWRALATPTDVAAKAAAATAATTLAPRDPRPRWLLALHVLWLVVHVAMENTFPRSTGGHWLCTWSWWSTALHCAVRLVEAVGPARLRERQVSSISFAASYGELVWTHTTFLVGPVNQTIDILIHAIPLVYMSLAAVLDESRRTRLPLHQAVRRAVLVGSLTYAYNLLYCWLFDYHFFYDRMFEAAHPTKWWAIMETNVMTSTAGTVYLLLNCQLSAPATPATDGKDGKSGHGAGVAAWASCAWARTWRFAVCLAVVLIVPGTMLLTIPTRPVMAHNCPAPPRILARRDHATGRVMLDPDGVAHGFAYDGVPSLFVHAMVGNDYGALSEAFGALTKMFLVDELYHGCAPIGLPAELLDLDRGGDAAEAIWVWTATLQRAHHNFGLITISDWQGLLRTGTVVVLIVPWQASKDVAAGAALALAPSANVFMPALPQTPQGARDLLSLLERAAQVARVAPGLRTKRAAAPEPAGEGCLVMSPTNTGDLPRGRCPHADPGLGRVALVARDPPPGAVLVTEDGQRNYCLGDAFRGMLQQQLPPEMAARLGCAVTSLGAYQLGEASFAPLEMENARWQTLSGRERVPYIMYQFPHYLLPAKRVAALGGGDLTWDDLIADLGAVLSM